MRSVRALVRVPGLLIILLAGATGAVAQDPAARPFVSPIFGDNMVLQRGRYRGLASPIKLSRTPATLRKLPPDFKE